MRARDLGITIGRGAPGRWNAITDVAGVRVGHTTLIEGEAVRTGVTVLFPHDADPATDPVFAGCHRLNGNGELTGLEWVRESGFLTSPIALTNTHSVGVVRDALIAEAVRRGAVGDDAWSLPVVGETWDGSLNDINGFHVRPEHVFEAIARAGSGPVAEGNVGGGTGMICHEFKGGIGTASRVLPPDEGGYTVGAARPGELRGPRAVPSGRRRRRRVDRARADSRRPGAPPGDRFDHRRPRNRCAAPSPPVRTDRAARRAGSRSGRRLGSQLERRHLHRFCDSEPGVVRARRACRHDARQRIRSPRSSGRRSSRRRRRSSTRWWPPRR